MWMLPLKPLLHVLQLAQQTQNIFLNKINFGLNVEQPWCNFIYITSVDVFSTTYNDVYPVSVDNPVLTTRTTQRTKLYIHNLYINFKRKIKFCQIFSWDVFSILFFIYCSFFRTKQDMTYSKDCDANKAWEKTACLPFVSLAPLLVVIPFLGQLSVWDC